jgi:hypothetical protein
MIWEKNIMKAVISLSDELNWQTLLDKPRVYADLNGGWRHGDDYTFFLDSRTTDADLQRLGYSLTAGLKVDFWTDDGDDEGNPDPLLFRGMIQFHEETQKWVAVTGWNDFRHASEIKVAHAQEPSLI